MKNLIAAVLLLGCGSAQSSTVVWDESIDGDLDGGSPGSFDLIIDLSEGVNILRGSHSWTGSSINTLDHERFTLSVSEGFTVTGIELQVENTSVDSVDFGGFEFIFIWTDEIPLTGLPTELGHLTGELIGDVTYSTTQLGGPTTPGLPVPIDARFFDFFTSAWKPSGSSTSQNWQLEFTVQPTVVPIPAAVWLFGSGLGLLGWMKRKRA